MRGDGLTKVIEQSRRQDVLKKQSSESTCGFLHYHLPVPSDNNNAYSPFIRYFKRVLSPTSDQTEPAKA